MVAKLIFSSSPPSEGNDRPALWVVDEEDPVAAFDAYLVAKEVGDAIR
jgi:hypothetical protein